MVWSNFCVNIACPTAYVSRACVLTFADVFFDKNNKISSKNELIIALIQLLKTKVNNFIEKNPE